MGAPVGNFNALKHGKRSPRIRQAKWEEERKRSAAWSASIPKTDYARIIAEQDRLQAEEEAEEARAVAEWRRRRGRG